MDMSLLIDADAVYQYVAKYCTKVEKSSTALKEVMRAAARNQVERGIDNPKSILRTAFNRLVGHRDKSISEVCHQIVSSQYVVCSHIFEMINLTGNLRRINTMEDGDESCLVQNIIDLYSERLVAVNWKNIVSYREVRSSLLTMNLHDFIKLYKKIGGKIEKRDKKSKPLVVVFSPTVKSDEHGNEYWKYCYLSLMKRKPWINFSENVFNGNKGCLPLMSEPSESVKENILLDFEKYFRDPTLLTYNTDSPIHRGVDSQVGENDNVENAGSQFSVDENLSFQTIYRGLTGVNELDNNVNDVDGDIQWDKEYDFKKPVNLYEENELSKEIIETKWKQVMSSNPDPGRNKIYLRDFDLSDIGSRQQYNIVLVALGIAGLLRNDEGEYLPPKKQETTENKFGNVIIVPGPAGTGTPDILLSIVC